LGNCRKFYISGTASIDHSGKTIDNDKEKNQIKNTLKNIRGLLQTEDSELKDIAMATAFCKNKKAYILFKELIKNSLKNIPIISVYADICRKELLFEMEAIAIKN